MNVKMYELFGEKKSIRDWCIAFDIPYATVHYRLRHNYDLVDALTGKKHVKKNAKKSGPYVRLAENNGIGKSTYYNRVYRLGWDKKQAATVPKGAIKRGRKKKETHADDKLETLMSIWSALNDCDKLRLIRMAEVTLEFGEYTEASA